MSDKVEDIQKCFYDYNTKTGCDDCPFKKECDVLTDVYNGPSLCNVVLGEIDTEDG